MKVYITALFCCISFFGYAQHDLKLFAEKKERTVILYASNNAFCPMSITLELQLENLSFDKAGQKTFAIPARTDSFKIGELNVIDHTAKSHYSYHYNSFFGDLSVKNYDTGFEYDLPYKKGNKFLVFQGYNGSSSHQNENALDFDMPEGTEVLAARDGIVVKVTQNNTEACPEKDCAQVNNNVTVYHSDGTLAEYLHLKYNSVQVKCGDKVKKGDLLAYSGNTGWSTGPHLHFDCFMPTVEKKQTIETKFRINNGTTADYLKEGGVYLREY